MKHLTNEEIVEFVDGTITNGRRSGVTAHLDECGQCRRETEVHRTVLRSAKSAPLESASPQLTAMVMERVLRSRSVAWPARILDNLGNVFAMMMVLGVVGYAVLNPPVWFSETPEKDASPVGTAIANTYERWKGSLTFDGEFLRQWTPIPAASKEQRVFLFAVVSLVALGIIDRVVVRKVRRLHT